MKVNLKPCVGDGATSLAACARWPLSLPNLRTPRTQGIVLSMSVQVGFITDFSSGSRYALDTPLKQRGGGCGIERIQRTDIQNLGCANILQRDKV